MTSLTRFGDARVLFLMAAEPEYGPHLQARFTPLITGVGPVESAVVATEALSRLLALGTLPDLVVSIGSAGSARLRKTDIYQVSDVSYRDMDASPLGFEKGATPFLDLPTILPVPVRMAGLPEATLSTGANVVHGDTYNDIPADMVDMETFSVLRVCHRFDVPLMALRGVSDGDAELSHVTDWTEYLHIIDEKLAAIVDQMAASLSSGSFHWPGYANLKSPVLLT